MFDKKANLLEVGQDVTVPNPGEKDIHSYGFIGTVVDILEDRGTVIVEDKASDFYEIEASRLVVRD